MSNILIDEATVKLVLEALEVAQDNLRDHSDNCFLHDEGEYNRCFCGKDSLSDHFQSVVEKLEEALAEQPAQQERTDYAVHLSHCNIGECEGVCKYLDDDCPALKHADMKAKWDSPSPQPAQRKPLTFSTLCDIEYEITHRDGDFSILNFARAIEAAHGIKENT